MTEPPTDPLTGHINLMKIEWIEPEPNWQCSPLIRAPDGTEFRVFRQEDKYYLWTQTAPNGVKPVHEEDLELLMAQCIVNCVMSGEYGSAQEEPNA